MNPFSLWQNKPIQNQHYLENFMQLK
ncbi:GTP cyclohydrolase II, partial [Escherichia coli]